MMCRMCQYSKSLATQSRPTIVTIIDKILLGKSVVAKVKFDGCDDNMMVTITRIHVQPSVDVLASMHAKMVKPYCISGR